jgi:hypothetical protein
MELTPQAWGGSTEQTLFSPDEYAANVGSSSLSPESFPEEVVSPGFPAPPDLND